MKRVTIKSYTGFMAIIMLALSLALSGCGGGGGTPATTAASAGTSASASLSADEQAAMNIVAKTPYLKSIDLGGAVKNKSGKFSLAATATRSATSVTRALYGSSVVGDCCAFVYAQFELKGTLTFNAADGTVVGTKDIDMFAYGNYELVKDAVTLEWSIVNDPVDGLVFSQGYAPYIQGVTTDPFGPYMPGDSFNVMATVQPYYYGHELIVSMQSVANGVKSDLTDDGVSPDMAASDYIYSGTVTIPSTAAAGDDYIAVIDIMDATSSFDLKETGDASNPYMYAYSGSLYVNADTLGQAESFTSASLSCASADVELGGATHCVVLGVTSDGTAKEVDNGDVIWSVSSGYGYVSEGGIVIPYLEGELIISAQIKESPDVATTSLNVTAPLAATTTETTAPTGVTAVAGDGQITVTWELGNEAIGYNVYVASETGVAPDNYTTLAGGTASMGVYPPVVIEGLTNGTTYYVVVTSLGVTGESTASAEVSAMPEAGIGSAPSAPQNVTASATGDGEVTITWDVVDGATYYNVYMASEAGVTVAAYSTLADGMIHSGETSPFVHTGLNNGFTYYFVVTAGNESGESAESAEVSATPAAALKVRQSKTDFLGKALAFASRVEKFAKSVKI